MRLESGCGVWLCTAFTKCQRDLNPARASQWPRWNVVPTRSTSNVQASRRPQYLHGPRTSCDAQQHLYAVAVWQLLSFGTNDQIPRFSLLFGLSIGARPVDARGGRFPSLYTAPNQCCAGRTGTPCKRGDTAAYITQTYLKLPGTQALR